ncbi:MAG: phosphatidate cytidylyltransferase [Gemmatimonadetes bacterium]|nr:phosphatidate cytidylyltransferase [Gemmatimonadota bacterium]
MSQPAEGGKKASELTQRVLVAAVGIPLTVGIVYVGGWALAILLMAASALAADEFYRLSEKKGAQPLRGAGAVLSAGFVFLVAANRSTVELAGFGSLIAWSTLLLATLSIWKRGVEGQPLLSMSTTLTGAIYTGGLLSFGYLLRHLPGVESAAHGTALVFAPVLITWSSDTFAYFVGRRWGTRKLIRRVSPGKTVQGSVGALVGSVLVAVAYSRLLAAVPEYGLTLLEAAIFGLVISVAAQVGDLAESLLKRDAGVKDSGTLLPGHGGALDRFDSLLFTLPIAYFFIRHWAPGL